MEDFFACYLWWLLLGILIGFFLFWLYDLLFRRDGNDDNDSALSRTDYRSSDADNSSSSNFVGANTANTASSSVAESIQPDLTAHMNFSSESLKTAAGYDLKPSKSGKDDLTVVEGIGPKISELLNADDIYTFRQLEQTPEERLQKILDEAGPSFKLAVPQSWPRQAGLCVIEDWKELREYQDRLFNGIEVEK